MNKQTIERVIKSEYKERKEFFEKAQKKVEDCINAPFVVDDEKFETYLKQRTLCRTKAEEVLCILVNTEMITFEEFRKEIRELFKA